MAKPWGIGNWAADVEREEQEAAEEAAAAAASGGPVASESQNFPSLREAVNTKPKKKKMTLNEFYSSSGGGGGRPIESKGLTPDEMLRLPTAPRERSAEEMQHGRLGGGFSNYGRTGPPPGRMRDRDESDGASWGGGRRQYGGFDEERRGPPSRVSEYDQPSRADEVDNWAMAKKPIASFDSARQNRYGSLGSGGGLGGGSRADEVDNWGAAKKTVSITTRSSTFGSGFRDSGPEPDRWARGVNREPERERPRLVLDPPKPDVVVSESIKTNKPNPFGAARPREDVLAEKGLDWKKLEMEMESKKTTSSHSSRPTSAHSSRPSSAHSARSEGPGLQQGLDNNLLSKPRPKVNPFGDAKPREVLLEERGQDWRKIDLDLEHRRVDRNETEEEKLLKEEIQQLKEHHKDTPQGSGPDQSNLQDIISQKEKELEQLIRDLDDKIRFGQKAVDRPGSGSGRGSSFSERPPSQSGSFDESRSVEYSDRPHSHGSQDAWTRPSDRPHSRGSQDAWTRPSDRPHSRGSQDAWTRPSEERRAFQSGSRDRGFQGSRDFGRSTTRERW